MFAWVGMPEWILSLSCIPVTKGLQVQLTLLLCSQAADFEIAGSDSVRHGNVHLQGGDDSNDSLIYVVTA